MIQITIKMFLTLIGVTLLILAEVTGQCSTSGRRCIGENFHQPCTAPPGFQMIACEAGFVCSPFNLEGVMCVPAPPSCGIKDGIFKVPDTCNSYYICVHSGLGLTKHIGYCEIGFEFSVRLGYCVLPIEAGCNFPEVTTTTQITTTPVIIPSTEPVTTQSSIETTNTTPTVSPTPAPPFICPSLGLHADVTSCRHYYRCTRRHLSKELVFIRHTCPAILPHFDPVKHTCWYFTERCVPHC